VEGNVKEGTQPKHRR